MLHWKVETIIFSLKSGYLNILFCVQIPLSIYLNIDRHCDLTLIFFFNCTSWAPWAQTCCFWPVWGAAWNLIFFWRDATSALSSFAYFTHTPPQKKKVVFEGLTRGQVFSELSFGRTSIYEIIDTPILVWNHTKMGWWTPPCRFATFMISYYGHKTLMLAMVSVNH